VRPDHTIQSNKISCIKIKGVRCSENPTGERVQEKDHSNIKFFFVNDLKEKISIQYCPTDDMIAVYMTKPLHGEKFRKFRQQIMNLDMPVMADDDALLLQER
jgi:hypothetical protein